MEGYLNLFRFTKLDNVKNSKIIIALISIKIYFTILNNYLLNNFTC